ncbi:MAG: ANTAR domain-containing protein [Eubacterium sp.]|nr:ANTAR domain-containing protein [Eubacterium sp.]
MSLKKQVYSVLVVSSSDNFNAAVASVLPAATYKPVKYVGSISAAQRAAAERSYDFIIVNTPLPDDLGARFAVDKSSSGGCIVLLLIQGEHLDDAYNIVSPHGVYTLPKPVSQQSMIIALRWMRTTIDRIKRTEKKATSIDDKMQEIRLVNRAKLLLISQEGYEEPEAHRYIEKSAMDRCVHKSVIAQEIINRYS